MPPRVAPQGGRGTGNRPARGGPRGGGPGNTRGGGPVNTRGGGPAKGIPSAHIETIGVRRTATGTSGRPLEVQTNHFAVEIPEDVIHHYDGKSRCSPLGIGTNRTQSTDHVKL